MQASEWYRCSAGVSSLRLDGPRLVGFSYPATSFLLALRAPTGAVIFTILLVIVPVSFLEPGLSPYMEAAPFNLTPTGVGVLFGVSAVADIAAAILAGMCELAFTHANHCQPNPSYPIHLDPTQHKPAYPILNPTPPAQHTTPKLSLNPIEPNQPNPTTHPTQTKRYTTLDTHLTRPNPIKPQSIC